mgnify:CR=1 FL=1
MGEGNEKNILEKEIGRHGTGLAMQVSCVSIVINVVPLRWVRVSCPIQVP